MRPRISFSLRAKLDAQPLKVPDHQKEALRFLTACTSLLGLLEKPNISPALLELRKIQDTMVGNLLGFMHAYNLRFGAASTPKQTQAYQPAIRDPRSDASQRSGCGQAGEPPTARANPIDATDFLQNLNEAGTRGGRSPRASQSQSPQ